MSSSVVLNLLWLVPGKVGGSEESTVASLHGLAELDPSDLDLQLLVLEPFADAHPEVVATLPTEVLRLSGKVRPVRVAAEATWLSRRTREADLVHHAGGTAPPGRRTPYVLTLHDLQPLSSGGDGVGDAKARTHGPVKRTYLRTVVPHALRGARRVIVPSAFVRGTVLAQTDLDPSRVVVVPHGVERGVATAPGDLVARYGIDGPVVLYPAITYPHKDHATLVEAFARVLVDHPAALLVLPGRPDSAEPDLLARIDRLGIGGRVRRLGRIPAADVTGLYDIAAVVAVPSRYEGFGLPAVEGMAHGVPVVASDATSLPEVVGDAGMLVAPGDVEEWAAAIGGLLGDPRQRTRLAAAGRQRANGFGRAANAAALAEVYRAALS
jgi:glycosyltransferase involved in cell wall biosynthesis